MPYQLSDDQYARICKEFGVALKECRDFAGQTQAEFADSLGYTSGSAVGVWECGRGLPRAKTLYKLAKWMGISIDYLFGVATDRHNEQSRARARARKAS